jgi:hypothetical protein
MRKSRINSIARQVLSSPGTGPLFYRSRHDPHDMVRMLTEPETLLLLTEIQEKYRLEEEAPDMQRMTMQEIGFFLGQIGTPNPGPGVTRNRDGKVICTIPYRRIRDPESPHYGKAIREPDVEMWRGLPR